MQTSQIIQCPLSTEKYYVHYTANKSLLSDTDEFNKTKKVD